MPHSFSCKVLIRHNILQKLLLSLVMAFLFTILVMWYHTKSLIFFNFGMNIITAEALIFFVLCFSFSFMLSIGYSLRRASVLNQKIIEDEWKQLSKKQETEDLSDKKT